MHDAHTSLKARCLELKVELSDLRDKIQKDNHDELIKRFSNLEITCAKYLEQTTALLTDNESLKVQIQNKLSCVNKDHVKPKVLAPGKYAIDVEPIPPRNRNNREVQLVYLKHLKESVETLREIASTSLPKKKQVTFEEQCAMSKSNTHKPVKQLNCQKTNVPVPSSTGVNSCTDASRSQPRSNTKKNRILLAKSVNMKKVVQIVLWYLDSSFSKHMTVDRSRLRNFMKKFIRTVRFRNDHFGAITGYGDYVIGESMISKAKAVATAVSGALCYPTNDSEDLGKFQPTADIGIFVGYAPSRKGYRIYNKINLRIMETIHVQFDELTEQMVPVQLSTGSAPTF
ncbi:hypothetical protein Tco_0054224 [Tanacetum coccineum]